MDSLTRVLHAIHGRSLWQVGVSYLLGVWAALQLTDTVSSVLGLPDGFLRTVLALLLAGLPLALLAAWWLGPAPAPASAGGGLRRVWRPAALAGAAGIALLGTATIGWVGTRTLGLGPARTLAARGELSGEDLVVLADFEGGARVAAAATAALRIDLEQSRALTLLDQASVRAALARMQRPDTARLDAATALVLAQREGAKAVIAGEINPLGSRWVVSARLLAAEDGRLLVAVREEAEDEEALVPAIGRVARRLRERAGEPLRAIRASEPLARATTASIDALRLYAQAQRALSIDGDLERAIALSEQAIALDSTFALAHVLLGVALLNRPSEAERMRAVLTRAFELRDRLSGPERHLVEAAYWDDAGGDADRAIAAYLVVHEEWPQFKPLMVANNLALLYEKRQDFARAAEFYRLALEADSSSFVPYLNLAVAQLALGQREGAGATLAAMRERHPGNPWNRVIRSYFASSGWNFDAAEAEQRALRAEHSTDPFWLQQTAAGLANLARVRGRLAEAERHLADLAALREADGDSAGALAARLDAASLDAWDRRLPGRALRTAETLLARSAAQPRLALARLYADARAPERARAVLEAYEREVPAEARAAEQQALRIVHAHVLLVEGDAQAAAAEASRAQAGACRLCPLPVVAAAHEAGGRPDSAIAVYERFLETPGIFRIDEVDARWLARVHEALAGLYERRGDGGQARAHYAHLAELWADADAELQPRVAAARAKVAELAPDR